MIDKALATTAPTAPALSPDPDLECMIAEVVPRDWSAMTVADYGDRGRRCVEMADYAGQALGHLALGGWEHLADQVRPDSKTSLREQGVTAWARWCASLWGCSRPTVLRAWALATGKAVGYKAGDYNSTRDAEILAACDGDVDAANAALDIVDEHGWRLAEVRLIARLQGLGLLRRDQWELPEIEVDGGDVYVRINNRRERVAQLLMSDTQEARIGRFLLLRDVSTVDKEV